MRRTKGAGSDMTMNMSYTNLAMIASEFEGAGASSRTVPASLAVGGMAGASTEALYQKAMELIQTGLRLDAQTPHEASVHYRTGADLLAQALDGADPGAQSDEMQRTLDMVEERIRFITRQDPLSRSGSEGHLMSATPRTPDKGALLEYDFGFPPTAAGPKPGAPGAAGAGVAEARAHNLFDLTATRLPSLAPELQAAVGMVSGIIETLTRHFGFQQESAHNQLEHLSMLIANSILRERDARLGLNAVHEKLLSNYKTWTRQLGVTQQCAGESDVAHNKATDLALYTLVWGEAANLRHVPESLCFLFHQMRREIWRSSPTAAKPPGGTPGGGGGSGGVGLGGVGGPSAQQLRPQGWFLSRVVAPLYRQMRTEMAKKDAKGVPLGHTRKCNYDDFNEFFWTPDCLKYSYCTADGDDINAAYGPGAILRGDPLDVPGAVLQPVSSMPVCKRYVERRSWLHPIRSFWRVHAFLILMLHVLLAIAFTESRTGVVVDASLVQALSGVVVTHGGLGVVREVLGVFTMHGMLHTHPKVALSLALRIGLKISFTILMFSSYTAMLKSTPTASLQGVDVEAWIHSTLLPNTTFCTVSGLYLVPVALSTLAQLFPILSTRTRMARGPLKALVDAFEPLNSLLVGKAIHTSAASKLPYDFFWLSLITLKLWFSYCFQIRPLVEPTRDLWRIDLSSWAPESDLGKLPNVIVLVVRWAPLMIMYMIDLQLWFMLWTAMYGTWEGCKLRIGEVPDLGSVRMRFLDAARSFNLKMLSNAVPIESAQEKPYPPRQRIADALRSGIQLSALQSSLLNNGSAVSHLESGDEIRNESLRYFAEAWNAILEDMRLSDLLSNRELEVLVFRSWVDGGGAHFSRCTYLPIFCTAGKLIDVFHRARTLATEAEGASDKRRQALDEQLYDETSAEFEQREALNEFLELTRWLICGLLGPRHTSAVERVITALDAIVANGEVLKACKPAHFSKLASAVVDLAKAVKTIQLEEEEEERPSITPPTELVLPGTAPASAPAPSSDADTEKALLDAVDRKEQALLNGGNHNHKNGKAPRLAPNYNPGKVVEKLKVTIDTLKSCVGKAPKALLQEIEGIKFTSAGLFWDDGYARDTLASLRAEEQCVEKLDGLVTICTTASIDTMPEEFEVKRRLCWFVGSLFMEMPKPPPVSRMHSWTVMTPFYSEDLLYSAKELAAKTEDGVSMLIFLKTVHETEWLNFLERVGVGKGAAEEARLFTEKPLLEELRLWASFRGQTLTRTVEGMMLHERALRLLASWEGLRNGDLDTAVNLKFHYVVSCQAYGNHKRSRDLKAADTEFLLQRYPSLRVAYVDKASSLTKSAEPDGRNALKEAIRFYSVLIKGVRKEDTGEAAVQEIYRVQLPGDIMLGEGKPENQNHAMIFTRGEALQTIDMNQCGYLEEAFKMRNLLCEFTAYPHLPQQPTILGFREHIFTGTSNQLSSLASYMALQEGCFVTLTQRVLWNPLQVRLHYGHPDVFDKLFSMTRGGVSKASRGINLSEDIYAGFNHLLRGSTIPYIEYVQVGKGRDVGMQQIYKFEAKLASGNAEQCLSRDVYRIGQRLDFTRLLSFYYSGPGFYFNNACTVFAMFVFLYLQLWTHILQLDAGVPAADLLNAQWVLQLGLLLTVPILCYLAVEHGIRHSISKFVETFVTGSPFFFMFHMGTKAHYYDGTLKYGGAKYRPTGRGFVMQHEDFSELYRFHAASHLYNGFELLWGLLLLYSLGDWHLGKDFYWRTCWSLWAVMVSWLFAPFWFNPLAFDGAKVRQDVKRWLLWMRRKDASPETSWEAWYDEEHAYLQTGSWLKKLHALSPGVRYALTFIGLLAVISERELHEGIYLGIKSLGAIVGAALGGLGLILLLRRILRTSHLALRVGSTFLTIGSVIAIPIILSMVSVYKLLLIATACGYALAAVSRVAMAIGSPRSVSLIMQGYDYLCGGLLLGLCCVLSVPQFCQQLQTKSLLSAVFERRIAHNEVMRLLGNTET